MTQQHKHNSASGLGVRVGDNGEVRRQLRAALDSQEWWMIPAFTNFATTVLSRIEEKLYDGEKNADFLIYILPPGLVTSGVSGIAIANKRHASPAQMAQILTEAGGVGATAEGLKDHDVIFATLGEPSQEELAAAVSFGIWLEQTG